MILLKITSTTDGKYLGAEIQVPVQSLEEMSKRQIQEFTKQIYEGRFVPDTVTFLSDSVRLVNSNYSVTLKVVDNG